MADGTPRGCDAFAGTGWATFKGPAPGRPGRGHKRSGWYEGQPAWIRGYQEGGQRVLALKPRKPGTDAGCRGAAIEEPAVRLPMGNDRTFARATCWTA